MVMAWWIVDLLSSDRLQSNKIKGLVRDGDQLRSELLHQVHVAQLASTARGFNGERDQVDSLLKSLEAADVIHDASQLDALIHARQKLLEVCVDRARAAAVEAVSPSDVQLLGKLSDHVNKGLAAGSEKIPVGAVKDMRALLEAGVSLLRMAGNVETISGQVAASEYQGFDDFMDAMHTHTAWCSLGLVKEVSIPEDYFDKEFVMAWRAQVHKAWDEQQANLVTLKNAVGMKLSSELAGALGSLNEVNGSGKVVKTGWKQDMSSDVSLKALKDIGGVVVTKH